MQLEIRTLQFKRQTFKFDASKSLEKKHGRAAQTLRTCEHSNVHDATAVRERASELSNFEKSFRALYGQNLINIETEYVNRR